MKRFYIVPFLLMFTFAGVWAQKSSEGSAKGPLGKDGKCLMVELEGQKDNVEDVLKKKFKKLKHGKSKGYDAFEAQIFPEISSQTLDIYYKVENAGKDKCKVLLFMSTGYDNWLTPQDHGQELNNAKQMLDGLIREVQLYELELAIAAQTKVLELAIKDQEKLVKEGEGLVKDQEKLQTELDENKQSQEDNKKTQEDQKKSIEDEKKTLDELQKGLSKVK